MLKKNFEATKLLAVVGFVVTAAAVSLGAAQTDENKKPIDLTEEIFWSDLTSVQTVVGPDSVLRTLKIVRKDMGGTHPANKDFGMALVVKDVPNDVRIVNYQAALVAEDSNSPNLVEQRGRFMKASVGVTTHQKPAEPKTIVVIVDFYKDGSHNHQLYIDLSVWCEHRGTQK